MAHGSKAPLGYWQPQNRLPPLCYAMLKAVHKSLCLCVCARTELHDGRNACLTS